MVSPCHSQVASFWIIPSNVRSLDQNGRDTLRRRTTTATSGAPDPRESGQELRFFPSTQAGHDQQFVAAVRLGSARSTGVVLLKPAISWACVC